MSIVTYNNRSIANISAIPGAAKALTHIKTLTASSSSTLSFVNGSDDVVLDSTYPIYLFKFITLHSASEAQLQVGFRDGGTDYDATKTTSAFRAYHFERDNEGDAGLGYQAGEDLAQSTSFQSLTHSVKTDNDGSTGGILHLFEPSSTTFVKHWMSNFNFMNTDPGSQNVYHAGYFNTTSAIDAIQFKFNSGNIDSGTIKLYGVS